MCLFRVLYLCLPLGQGVLDTTHFLLSVCGVQVCDGMKAGEVSGLWICGRGTRTRDCEPFLNPHVLFFFMQEPHWLHSPNSHSAGRWPGWQKKNNPTQKTEVVSEQFTAPTSHICFAAFLSAFYSSAVLALNNEFKRFPNLKAILSHLVFWLQKERHMEKVAMNLKMYQSLWLFKTKASLGVSLIYSPWTSGVKLEQQQLMPKSQLEAPCLGMLGF